jgi:hypothetical protein
MLGHFETSPASDPRCGGVSKGVDEKTRHLPLLTALRAFARSAQREPRFSTRAKATKRRHPSVYLGMTVRDGRMIADDV